MRISSNTLALVAPARRDAGTAAKAAFMPAGTQAASSSPAGPTGLGTLASLGSILAVQGVPDPLEQRRRARRRADQLLDELEELQLALLEGQVPASLLGQLRDRLDQIEIADDPQLKGIITAIEQRAEVELAKLERLSARPDEGSDGADSPPGEAPRQDGPAALGSPMQGRMVPA